MRRYVPVLIAGSALIAAACRDAVAPTRQETPETTLRQIVDQSYASAVSNTEGANAVTVTFQILPGGGTQRVGDFTLSYDARSVCDPSTSGYGPETWKRSCTTLDVPITITARFWTEDGRHVVDFSPDIRFSPDKNVTLAVYRPEIVGQRKLTKKLMKENDIWYTKRVGNSRHYVDEGHGTAALRTHFDRETGKVWRNVWHFSGYVVHTGFCTENPSDPSCTGGEE